MSDPLVDKLKKTSASLLSQEDQIIAKLRDSLDASPAQMDSFIRLCRVMSEDFVGIRKLSVSDLDLVSFLALTTARRILASTSLLTGESHE